MQSAADVDEYVEARARALSGDGGLAAATELLATAKARPAEFRQAAAPWHHLFLRALGSDNESLVGKILSLCLTCDEHTFPSQ